MDTIATVFNWNHFYRGGFLDRNLCKQRGYSGGSLFGLALGKRPPERIKTIFMQALVVSTTLIGVQRALNGNSFLIATKCLLAGALTGEVLKIEQRAETAVLNAIASTGGFIIVTGIYSFCSFKLEFGLSPPLDCTSL